MTMPKDRALHTDARRITCDGCGTHTYASGDTNAQARATAARSNWWSQVTPRKTEDYCPTCHQPDAEPLGQLDILSLIGA